MNLAGNAFKNISADEGCIIFDLSPLLTNRGEGITLLEKSKREIKNAKKLGFFKTRTGGKT